MPARYLSSNASVVKLTIAVPIFFAVIVFVVSSMSMMSLFVVEKEYVSSEGSIVGRDWVSPIVISYPKLPSSFCGIPLNTGSIGPVVIMV